MRFRHCFLVFAFALGLNAQAQQANIVFIISDDAGFADWGFMDPYTQSVNPGQVNSPVPTPNLDRLRDRGVLFTNAYTAAVCSPSRAAIFTGSYQQRIGYEFNINNLTDPDGPFEGLRSEDVTIFERMRERGYTTGAIGKWHVGAIPDVVEGGVVTRPGNRPPRQGVDEFFGVLRGSRNYSVGPSAGDVTRALREMSLDANGLEVNNDIEAAHDGEYVTNTFGQGAVDFIDRHHDDETPFFLYVSFTAPHSPIGASPDRNEPGISSNYGSMVFTMDKEIGRIMDKIADPVGDGSVDLSAETLFIFINDNGGASGNGTRNTPLRDWKGSTYEGGVRVPMIFAGAGVNATPGSVYSEPVHSIDVLATCHELAGGAPLSGQIDGVNLLPFVNGVGGDVPHEAVVIRSRGRYGIRMGDWKLTRDGIGSPQLFDLTVSIDEADGSDVASANPAVVAQMLRILTEHEIGFDKPRFHGLGSSPDSINRNDAFRFAPFAPTGGSFVPDLVLVAPGVKNGGFESPAFGSDQHSYAEVDGWVNIGTGNQDEALVRTNLGDGSPQNAVISQNGGRVAAIDTGHILSRGETFRVSYRWRDASGWADVSDRIGFTFYTTSDDMIGGTIVDSTEILSELSMIDSAYESADGLFVASAAEAGKRLFVAFTGVDGSGSTGGFARVDNVRIERGTTDGDGGGSTELSWSTGGAWTDTETEQSDSLLDIDAFAGATLEFPVSSGFSYVANNDMKRATGEDFMLNKMVLSGSLSGDDQSARIRGNTLLLTESLDGKPAMIENNASGLNFSFLIETSLIPWSRLLITGDGDAGLTISGAVGDYDTMHVGSVIKRGMSTLKLSGSHPFSGSINIESGRLELDDANLSGTSGLNLASGAFLAGTGTIAGDVDLNGTVAIALDGGDRIDALAALEFDGASLSLTGQAAATPRVIMSYAQLAGQFVSVAGLPVGYSIDYAFEGNQIAIVSEPDPYIIWAESVSGLSGERAAFDADANGDGIANGIAFFLGATDANTDAHHLLPSASTVGEAALFVFERCPQASSHPFAIRYSSDLNAWATALHGVDGASISVVGDQISATLPTSLTTGGKLYLSLSVGER